MKTSKQRTGRPTKAPAPGTRVSLGLKVTPSIKSRLDSSAKENGRTQSQEAEARLERSFANQELLSDVLESTFGKPGAGLLLLIGRYMKMVGPAAGFASDMTLEGSTDWMNNPYAFKQFAKGLDLLICHLTPPGAEWQAPNVQAGDFNIREIHENLGVGFAQTLINAITRPADAPTKELQTFGKVIREKIEELHAVREAKFRKLSDGNN